jgi:hypothetical protein
MDFPIRLQPRLRPILLLFGVRPDNALVRLDEERLVARFGFFTAEAPLANIARWDITGPYRWWRGLGVRRTLGTHDLSFSGSRPWWPLSALPGARAGGAPQRERPVPDRR